MGEWLVCAVRFAEWPMPTPELEELWRSQDVDKSWSDTFVGELHMRCLDGTLQIDAARASDPNLLSTLNGACFS